MTLDVVARRAVAIVVDVVVAIVEVVAHRAVAIIVTIIVCGVIIVVVVVVIVVGLQPHANPAPATQASNAFRRMLGEGASTRRVRTNLPPVAFLANERRIVI